MAKAKPVVETTALNDLAVSLMGDAQDRATSSNGYLLGDHAENTWGIELPHIAVQYVVGGSNILPLQRWYSAAGKPKSTKSTFQIQVCCWYAMNQGFARYIDAEEKASASMFKAMTWWQFLSPEDPYTDSVGNFCFYPDTVPRDPDTRMPIDMDHPDRVILITPHPDPMIQQAKKRLIYTPVTSIDDYQVKFSETLKWARNMVQEHPERKEKGSRVSIYTVIDSLTGKDYEGNIADVEKEGHAQERSFAGAARANMISSFLRTVSFRGTCMAGGYVRHLATNIGDGSFASRFEDKHKESGGDLSNYQASVNLRFSKWGEFQLASHPAMPISGPPVEGYMVGIDLHFSCLGPDIKRKIQVEVMWQYVEMPDGSAQQIMRYDWPGALGRMLYEDKYSSTNKVPKFQQERLDKTIYFVQAKANHVKCEALLTPEEQALPKEERDKAAIMHFHEFGRRIEASPEHVLAVQRYLGITRYPTVQQADIDWTGPTHTTADQKEKKGRK
jgi:hypothetical protein